MTFNVTTTIENVLIPFDGRVESAALLVHALGFSRSAKRLTLALLDGTSGQGAQDVISAMKIVACEPTGVAPEVDFLRCDAVDDLCDVILELAKHHHSEMILWALHEDSGPVDRDEFATGSTTGEELALNASIPVMIFRADMEPSTPSLLQPERILVPLDDSLTSGMALPVAVKLARLYNVPIHLVTVIDPTSALPPAYAYLPSVDLDRQDALEALHGVANQVLSRAEIYLQRLDQRVTSELVMGATDRCLLSAIQKGDLVVMTTHGQGNASKSRFGSVALRIVRNSPVPVVILHPGDSDNRGHVHWGRHALIGSQVGPSANAAR